MNRKRVKTQELGRFGSLPLFDREGNNMVGTLSIGVIVADLEQVDASGMQQQTPPGKR